MIQNRTHVLKRSLDLFAADVTFKVIKVDVTPAVRADVNQFNMSSLTNKFLDVPCLASHRLSAFTGGASHNLEYKNPEVTNKWSMTSLTNNHWVISRYSHWLLLLLFKGSWQTEITMYIRSRIIHANVSSRLLFYESSNWRENFLFVTIRGGSARRQCIFRPDKSLFSV